MRILLIHQFFLGKGDSGGSRWNQMSKYWASKGHEVTVIAGNLNYQTGKRYEECNGKFILEQQEGPGVRVLRCHVNKSYGEGSKIGRALGLLTFIFSSIVAGLTRAPRPDIIIATCPPLGVSITMWVLSVFYGVPAVFEVRDLWPDSLVEEGLIRDGLVLRAFFKMEYIGYHRSQLVNVLTPGFKRWIMARKGLPESRIAMIPNAADLDLMVPGPKDNYVRQQLNLQGKFVVSYFGAHGQANALHQVLDTAALLREEAPDVVFLLVGSGPEKTALMEQAKQRGLTNVQFVAPVSKNQVGDYINASDVCTATLRNIEHYALYYPNKVFDYMSCARPIIIAIDGVARELVEQSGTGLFVHPENAESFAQAIRSMRSDPAALEAMGARGPAYVRENFDRKKLAMKYLGLITQLVERQEAIA